MVAKAPYRGGHGAQDDGSSPARDRQFGIPAMRNIRIVNPNHLGGARSMSAPVTTASLVNAYLMDSSLFFTRHGKCKNRVGAASAVAQGRW
jgi:hypothetical protein